MNNVAFKLLLKIFLLSIPLLMLSTIYFIYDPFKVLYKYNTYYHDYSDDVPLNRDFVSTELLLKNIEKYHYNSFIFGSSKSASFTCNDWNEFIRSNPYHYDASGESIYGILGKLKLLDKMKIPIKHCLISLDSATLQEATNSKKHLYIKHPVISGESKLMFQWEFLSAFLSNHFFIPYFIHYNHIKIFDFMELPGVFEFRNFSYNEVTNDITFAYAEDELKINENKYYSDRLNMFKRENMNIYKYPPFIDKDRENILREIKSILDKNNTDYRIVLYPVFNMRKINPEDSEIIRNIFGVNNVFDFSGVNNITSDYKNYYEVEHCRISAGKLMLKEMYRGNTK